MRLVWASVIAIAVGCNLQNSALHNDVRLRGADRVVIAGVCTSLVLTERRGTETKQVDVGDELVEALATAFDRELPVAWKKMDVVPLSAIGLKLPVRPESRVRCARGLDPFVHKRGAATTVDPALMASVAKRVDADVALALEWSPALFVSGDNARVVAATQNPIRVFAVDADGEVLGSFTIKGVEGKHVAAAASKPYLDGMPSFAAEVARELLHHVR